MARDDIEDDALHLRKLIRHAHGVREPDLDRSLFLRLLRQRLDAAAAERRVDRIQRKTVGVDALERSDRLTPQRGRNIDRAAGKKLFPPRQSFALRCLQKALLLGVFRRAVRFIQRFARRVQLSAAQRAALGTINTHRLQKAAEIVIIRHASPAPISVIVTVPSTGSSVALTLTSSSGVNR